MDYQSFQPNPPAPQMPQQMPPVQKTFTPKFIGVIVGLLVLGGVAYGGMWYWQKQQVVQEVVPTFTPRVDETANWKTYTNTQYGFEIKHPEDWVFTKEFSQADGFFFTKNYFLEHSKIAIFPRGEFDHGIMEEGVVTDQQIDNKNTKKLSWSYRSLSIYYITDDTVPSPWIVCKFDLRNCNRIEVDLNGKEDAEIAEKILSTFKFIEPTTDSILFRDTKRYLDVHNFRVALELYSYDNQKYPGTLEELKSLFPYLNLVAPMPVDGNCSQMDNAYKYTLLDNGKSYSLKFCLGKLLDSKEAPINGEVYLGPGVHTANPSEVK